MQLVRGGIKVQHGIYRIYEMLALSSLQEKTLPFQVAGYAIFDLADQRLSENFISFQTAISEINNFAPVIKTEVLTRNSGF